MKLQSLLVSILALSVAAVEVQPAKVKGFFKGVATDILGGAAATVPDRIVSWVSDDKKEIADSLADVIEEDCQSVCLPAVGGDIGAHVIQCVQCISEELGAVLFPEFLEAVLTIRSPELLQDEEQQHEELEKKEASSESKDGLEAHDSLGLDEIMMESDSGDTHLIEELTDAFETQGVSLFKALLGECRDDCASVILPHSDPFPCLRCMSAHSTKEDAQLSLNFVNRALTLFNY